MSLKAILICLMALIVMVNGAVPSNCLGCICQASTGCNVNEQCHHSNSYFCGPFLISYNYWATAGRPLHTYTNADIRGAFEDCVQNIECASKTINLYMEKEAKDCNGDGQLTCEDYVRIHKYGPNGCGQPLTGEFGELYYACATKLVKYYQFPLCNATHLQCHLPNNLSGCYSVERLGFLMHCNIFNGECD